MSEFLLLGSRPSLPLEMSPRLIGHDIAISSDWYQGLRRWGLLRAFGVQRDPFLDPASWLVVGVSGLAEAQRLAEGWERAAGYVATVLPLLRTDVCDERGHRP